MQKSYEITNNEWTPITTVGLSGNCWLSKEIGTLKGKADVVIYHADSLPAVDKVPLGYPVYIPTRNGDTVPFTADSGTDILYARCISADSGATIIVDAI